jgi:hypothetical protein
LEAYRSLVKAPISRITRSLGASLLTRTLSSQQREGMGIVDLLN